MNSTPSFFFVGPMTTLLVKLTQAKGIGADVIQEVFANRMGMQIPFGVPVGRDKNNTLWIATCDFHAMRIKTY